MRAAILSRPGPIEARPLAIVDDAPEPVAGPGMVTLRVRARGDGMAFLAEAARLNIRTRTQAFPLAVANEALLR